MCGESFWKRAVVFCLAFGLSVFASWVFIPKELPFEDVKPQVNTISEKNCVPVDKNLKYENLPLAEQKLPSPEEEKPVVRPRSSDKKNQVKELDKREEKKEEKTAETQFYDPSKDSAEYKILLHRERCIDAQGQK